MSTPACCWRYRFVVSTRQQDVTAPARSHRTGITMVPGIAATVFSVSASLPSARKHKGNAQA